MRPSIVHTRHAYPDTMHAAIAILPTRSRRIPLVTACTEEKRASSYVPLTAVPYTLHSSTIPHVSGAKDSHACECKYQGRPPSNFRGSHGLLDCLSCSSINASVHSQRFLRAVGSPRSGAAIEERASECPAAECPSATADAQILIS